MVLVKIAIRNLRGIGMRFWLNVAVIAISIIIVLFAKGIYAGLTRNMLDSVIKTEVGGGHFVSEGFVPMDSLTFDDSLRKLPVFIKKLQAERKGTPVIYSSATLYRGERSLPITMKGILPEQSALTIPTESLKPALNGVIPILVGTRMLKSLKAVSGDIVTLKWRDSKGSFDALDFEISAIMNTRNPRVDENSVWLNYHTMEKLINASGKAHYFVVNDAKFLANGFNLDKGWQRKDIMEQCRWFLTLIEADEKNFRVVFALLLFLCGIGIFNSQVVSVFKRKKEIGTLMAIGLRNSQIVTLFALEGALTTLVACSSVPLLGFPLFYWSAKVGFSSAYADGVGLPLPEKIMATYEPGTAFITVLFIFLLMSFISWFPVRKIANLEPATALSGRSSH